jgi:hypothetical protein
MYMAERSLSRDGHVRWQSGVPVVQNTFGSGPSPVVVGDLGWSAATRAFNTVVTADTGLDG